MFITYSLVIIAFAYGLKWYYTEKTDLQLLDEFIISLSDDNVRTVCIRYKECVNECLTRLEYFEDFQKTVDNTDPERLRIVTEIHNTILRMKLQKLTDITGEVKLLINNELIDRITNDLTLNIRKRI